VDGGREKSREPSKRKKRASPGMPRRECKHCGVRRLVSKGGNGEMNVASMGRGKSNTLPPGGERDRGHLLRPIGSSFTSGQFVSPVRSRRDSEFPPSPHDPEMGSKGRKKKRERGGKGGEVGKDTSFQRCRVIQALTQRQH